MHRFTNSSAIRRFLRPCTAALITAVLALSARAVHAQAPGGASGSTVPAAGSLVRVTLPPDLQGRRVKREAIVVGSRADSMRLAWRAGDTASLALVEMHQLELGLGTRRPIAASMGWGALAGGVGLGLITYLSNESDFLFNRGELAAAAGLVGALGGAVIGGVVGATRTSERWRTVYRAGDRLGVAVTPVLGRTRGVHVRVSF